MPFDKEADFEEALIGTLKQHGWDSHVLRNCTEKELLENWAYILFNNNRGIDRLNNLPLTVSEMQQILEQIAKLRTPLELNGFINGGTVTIRRDNEQDKLHFGKEVALKIYDRREIAAGQSHYQIAQQPRFDTGSEMTGSRRGDLMLLINGMPVIHIELKKSGVPVSDACHQIERYAKDNVFTGLFSLIQVFVVMNPEETRYFANPGPDGKFNQNYFFRWADFNNEPILAWDRVAATLLSIPMAHQLIGFYTVADKSDGVLKVMRSYQYYAANAISDRVAKATWEDGRQLGGYIWHTTGSGKTMTSFKSAQLIATSKDADKVIFLMDRIELGTQSLNEYRDFADESETVQRTENTGVLVAKLKSDNPSDTLIVTSIQKMSNIRDEADDGFKAEALEKMRSKRIVFIVDECHRSTFGDMLMTVKKTFPNALFFGFTGTPIQEENQKKKSTTATVFGSELHRYSIADGIRDENVLGFDPYKVLTYKDNDLRKAVALEKAKAQTEQEALADPKKSEVYRATMRLPMAGTRDDDGTVTKGIEDYIKDVQYECEAHQRKVVEDILENWVTLSQNGKFHAIFATSSINEALQYYRLLKREAPWLRVTALFDPSIDNNGKGEVKEEGLKEIITDYNVRFDQTFTIPTFANMKKDIADRLAHKGQYIHIAQTPELELDLLIVVDQMLTGYDSKWVNTLYMDKILRYEHIIQAFSRTNRLFGPEKPFGTIRYYRRPHTMERNVADAVKLYSGDKPLAIFVERLPENIRKLNAIDTQIKALFKESGVGDLSHLPEDVSERKKFASLFKEYNTVLEAARIQGFHWDKKTYVCNDPETGRPETVEAQPDEQTYQVLALRYKELATREKYNEAIGDVPYDIDGYLMAIDTEHINAEYMNSRFTKYLKLLHQEGTDGEQLRQAEAALHATFAMLPATEQKYANILLHDIASGKIRPVEGKTFRDYIIEEMTGTKDRQIRDLVAALGINETLLRDLMSRRVTEANINEFDRFAQLKATADKAKAKAFFDLREPAPLIPPKVTMKIDGFLRDFILSDGFDLE